VADFRGFPAAGLDFFTALAGNNNRDFWLANKSTFEASVREPMVAFLDSVADEFGTFHLFRMNRDVRFSKDKSPYKTAQAAVTETEGGATHYLQLGADGLFVGGGMYHLAKDQLARFRAAVADDSTGPALERAIAAVRKGRVEVSHGFEAPLVTAPKGYPKDHPRIELLQWKGVIAHKQLGAPAWLHTRRAAAEIVKVWRTSAPLLEWLDDNVGPSTLPPPEFDRP
jgi:uncharacterized protein (TIGR02453 family)